MNLGMSASEAHTFLKHFGMIIGHKIDGGDEHWEAYISLNEIVTILV